VEADEESLMLLARKGNGALRDALSAFDQALSLCGATLEYGELTQALGVVDQDLFFRLTDHVATQDTAGMIELVRHVVRSGYDLQEMLVGLAEHLRNLLVARSLGGDALEEVAESTRTRYAEEAERFEEADLLRLLTLAADTEDDIKQSPQPRLTLETTLLKMAQLRRSADLRAVLDKIDRLEQMAEAGELPASMPGDGAASDAPSTSEAPSDEATPTDTTEAPTEPEPDDTAAEPMTEYGPDSVGPSSDPSPESSPPDENASSEAPEPSPTLPADDASAEGEDDEGEDEEEESSDSGPPRRDSGEADPSVEYDDLFGSPALGAEDSSNDEGSSDTTDARASSADAPTNDTQGGTATVAEPAVASGAAPDGVAAEWPQVVQTVKEKHISIGSLLGEAEPVEYADGTLTIAVPRALHRDTLRDRRRVLLQHVTATVDVAVDDLRFVVEATSDEASADSGGADETLTPREQLEQLRDTYPALNVLFGEFGAEPVW
jgi:DNA polymerase-3 subunit gamma/tau